MQLLNLFRTPNRPTIINDPSVDYDDADFLMRHNTIPLTEFQKKYIPILKEECDVIYNRFALTHAKFKTGQYVHVISGNKYYFGEKCVIWGIPTSNERACIFYALKNKKGVFWTIEERHLVLSIEQHF